MDSNGGFERLRQEMEVVKIGRKKKRNKERNKRRKRRTNEKEDKERAKGIREENGEDIMNRWGRDYR